MAIRQTAYLFMARHSQHSTPKMRRVLIISIDSLLPENYQDKDTYLFELAQAGTYAEEAVSVYPTLSMTNHATLATGVYADRHGVIGNTRFERDRISEWIDGESKDWYMDASDLKAPALWDLARKSGRKVALLRWPCTRGAEVDWLVPDVFSVRPGEPRTWELTRNASTPRLIQKFSPPNGFPKNGDDHGEMDQWIAEAAVMILESSAPEAVPDLMMVHFNSYDHESHAHGRDSEPARQALRKIESSLIRIIELVDLQMTSVFILGDHGCLDFTKRVHLNALFESYGWIQEKHGKVVEWRVIAHTHCGQAAIYLKNPHDEKLGNEVLQALSESSGNTFRILDRATLRALRAFPNALCAVEGLPGFSMGQNLRGPWIEDIGRTRGEHGYLPTLPEMKTGFVAFGNGIGQGRRLNSVRLLDIAPTAADLLGIQWAGFEGKSIDFGDAPQRRAG